MDRPCDGGYVCEAHGGHRGECRWYRVVGRFDTFRMWYCDVAAEEDRRRGFKVELDDAEEEPTDA